MIADQSVRKRVSFVVVLAAAAAFGQRGAGQQLLSELKLPGEFEPTGDAVGSLGDVTGDGVPDLLVAGNGGTFIKSGSDGTTLALAPSDTGGDTVLAVDGVGDLDGDGTADFVSVTEELVRAYSGADCGLLWSLPAAVGSDFMADVEALGDVDGDGQRDVAVAEPFANSPVIRVVSADGSVHVTHAGLGPSTATIEWDGTPGLELIVGEPNFTQPGNASGRVRVVDPLSGATLATFLGGADDHIGSSVASLGDVNGDSVPDLLASSQHTAGGTMAWSGADGTVLYFLPSSFSRNLESVGDVNGDGRPDWVGGGPNFGFGFASLRNGATGASIKVLGGIDSGSFATIDAPGDVSGDGLPDLLVGSTGAPPTNKASAWLVTLPSGSILMQLSNPNGGGSLLGRRLDGVGDYDGDGNEDLVLASSFGAAIFSTNGELLAEIDTSTTQLAGADITVAGPGDVNSDGVPDVALGYGYDGTSQQGRIALYSGATGAELHALAGTSTNEFLGMAVVDVPDRDDDGVRDLYVGVPGGDFEGVSNCGEVRLLSGATLAQIDVLRGDGVVNDLFGWTLDAGGDLDQDGVTDLAVGGRHSTMYLMSGATGVVLTRQTSAGVFSSIFGSIVGDADGDGVDDYLARVPNYYAFPTTEPGGRVQLFSGATNALLWEQVGAVAYGMLGEFAAGVGDVNGDGYADVGISERSAHIEVNAGAVWVRSGKDGTTLDHYILPPVEITWGAGEVRGVGLIDAGGCADIVVGIPGLGGNGGARVLASSDGGVHGFVDLGFSKPGTGVLAPQLRGYGDLAAGAQVSIKVRHARPSTNGAWFVSLVQGNHPFKQGVLVPSVAGAYFMVPLNSNGAGDVTLTGANPAFVFAGLSFYHQFWFVDPAATVHLSATNGLREIFK